MDRWSGTRGLRGPLMEPLHLEHGLLTDRNNQDRGQAHEELQEEDYGEGAIMSQLKCKAALNFQDGNAGT